MAALTFQPWRACFTLPASVRAPQGSDPLPESPPGGLGWERRRRSLDKTWSLTGPRFFPHWEQEDVLHEVGPALPSWLASEAPSLWGLSCWPSFSVVSLSLVRVLHPSDPLTYRCPRACLPGSSGSHLSWGLQLLSPNCLWFLRACLSLPQAHALSVPFFFPSPLLPLVSSVPPPHFFWL